MTDLQTLTDNIPGGMHQCLADPYFTITTMSNSFLALFGYSREEIAGQFHNRFIEMIDPDDRPMVKKALRAQLSTGNTLELEYRVRRKDGTLLWVLDKGKLARLPDGTPTLYCVLLDVTQQRKEREELRLSLERHRIISDQTTDIIFEWNIPADTLSFSTNWRKKFGYDPIREKISSQIPLSKNIHSEDIDAFIKIMKDTASGVPYSEAEFRIRDTFGAFTWCRIRATTQYDENHQPVKAVGVILDIDQDKKQRQLLMEQALHDSLTGLLNKAAVKQQVETALNRSDMKSGILFLLDLDDFKNVNDRYGHLCGDTLLADAAGELKRLFRSTDIVGRIGGDEFLIFLPDATDAAAAKKAREIMSALSSVTIDGGRSRLSCSIGSASFPRDSRDFYSLYHCADLALYHVKYHGKGRHAAFLPHMRDNDAPGGSIRSFIGSTIDSDAESVKEKLGQYCFKMLYHSVDIRTAVPQLLEIVGRAYDVSRVYIFESSADGLRCSNTFEWCNNGITPQLHQLQGLSYEELGSCPDHFNEAGIFYCSDIRQLHPSLYKVLAPQGIRSLLQCAIMDDGEFKGYVGFDDCAENRYWTKDQADSLSLIANVLSTFLLKLRLKERLQALTASLPDGE